MISEALSNVVNRRDLSEAGAQAAMDYIMEGHATDAQISAFITALRMKGETVAEITGFARAMRSKVTRIRVSDPDAVDTCGTGGDGKNTLNVSTISAFVAAGAGATVAKHGNRSVSSACGSADLLAALGVNIKISPDGIAACLSRAGIGFLFAPMLHKAMRFAVNPRKEIGIRTVFNILGPLTNPAGVTRQVVGVFDEKLTEPLARVLNGLGADRAFVVHGHDGIDEISVSAETTVSEVRGGKVSTYTVAPEDFGFVRRPLTEIVCSGPSQNKSAALAILNGEKGAGRDVVLMNAGAALAAADTSMSIAGGVELAKASLDSGKALKKVEALVRASNAAK